MLRSRSDRLRSRTSTTCARCWASRRRPKPIRPAAGTRSKPAPNVSPRLPQPWVEFFLTGVVEQARDTAKRIKQIQDLRQVWHDMLYGHKESASTIRLADYLFESPVITVSRAQEVLGMSYPGAQRVVATLCSHGILVLMDERKYGRSYLARDVLLGIFGNSAGD